VKKYIVSKKHKATSYLGASVVTASVLLSSPVILSAESNVSTPTVIPIDVVETKKKEKENYKNSYKVTKSSSSKITQDLLDTPQTISVVTEKVLKEQQATTLQEALRNTPGITLNLGENGNTDQKNNIMMRGFDTQSSIYKDGVRDSSNSVKDMYNTEAVEITKGAVGADNGRGVSSGYINQVTKGAKITDEAEVNLGYSTGENARVTTDINKKLNETTGLRINLLKHKGDVAGRDVVEIDRTGIAASLGFGIGTNTRTTINYERFKQDDIPDGGIPTIGLDNVPFSTLDAAGISASEVDREKFYGSDSDFEKATSDTYSLLFEHDFSDNMTVSNITKYTKTKQEMLIKALRFDSAANVFISVTDPSTWTYQRMMNQKWEKNEVLVNKTNLSSTFDTGSIGHSLSTGLEYIKEKKTTKAYKSAGTNDRVSVYNSNPSASIAGVDLSFNAKNLVGEVETVGAYLFDSISLTDKLMFIGGGRVDRYELKQSGVNVDRNGVASDVNEKDSGTLKSWKVGFVYKPLENGSVYISHATSQLQPGGNTLSYSTSASSLDNPNKDPEESTTTELGTKWDFLDNRLSLTAAVYKTLVKNQVTAEDDGTYTQEGEKEVKGIEIGVVGQVTDKFSISAGFAKDKTKSKAKGRSDDGAALRFTPDWSATLWSTYNFTPAFTVGLGATYMGEQKVSSSKSGQDTPVDGRLTLIDDFLVFDAMASYQIDKHSSLQLNVYNLADEEYVANTNKDGFRYTPGAARSALVTYSYKF
jgi:catecholate siderophore receptor